MLTYQQALKTVLETANSLPAVDRPLGEALGQVLASPIQPRWVSKPVNVSAMDGYAFAYAGQKVGSKLFVSGFIGAGSVFSSEVPAGQAVKIMTGASVPIDCDTIVPVEEVLENGEYIFIESSPKAGQHVRSRGGEFRLGETLVAAGTRIHSGEIGLLAENGIDRVKTYSLPRVTIISTGDELVELGNPPKRGQIVDTNSHFLAARLREEGFEVNTLGIARDDIPDLSERLAQGLKGDVLITTGGVSVGDRDYVQSVLTTLGLQRKFWKVAIKPGKPLLFGTIEEKLVFGLPGNPAASAATLELFVLPALRKLAGFEDPLPKRTLATLTADVKGMENFHRFLWGKLDAQGGHLYFSPSDYQESDRVSGFSRANAILPIPADKSKLPAGTQSEIFLLRLPFFGSA